MHGLCLGLGCDGFYYYFYRYLHFGRKGEESVSEGDRAWLVGLDGVLGMPLQQLLLLLLLQRVPMMPLIRYRIGGLVCQLEVPLT